MNDDQNQTERLEIYKLQMNIADRVNQRIDLTHRLFFGLMSAVLLFLFGTILSASQIQDFLFILRTSAGAGVLFSVFWWLYLRSYHFDKRAKYKALRELEESLAVRFLEREEAIRRELVANRLPSIRQFIDLLAPLGFFLLFLVLLFVNP